MLVLKGLVEPFNFSFFSVTGWGIGLDYCDIECVALETNFNSAGNFAFGKYFGKEYNFFSFWMKETFDLQASSV